jgi:intein/homing endonuclease
MKGIVFSSDFVLDSNGNERLLEINTDTGFLLNVVEHIDFTEFFSVLNENSISKVSVVYKKDIHSHFVNHLSSSLNNDAPYITSFDKIEVAESNIFPSIPNDDTDTFILRLAYDESAIIDSEYAKGTLELLKLFVDNNDSGSVCNFYHSSSLEGYYNTLDGTINDDNSVPDFVIKKNIEQRQQATFYKVGKSSLTTEERFNEFLEANVSDTDMIQQYHFSSGSVNSDNKITSIRSFKIVYGGDLNIISLLDYEIESIFDLPTNLLDEIDDNEISNELSSKHYYEFATNFAKTPIKVKGGLLGSHEVVMEDGTLKEMQNLVVGDRVKSYFISGSPMRDNLDEVLNWESSGNTLPTGSFMTSSVVENTFSSSIENNLINQIKAGSDDIYSAISNTFLVQQSNTNSIVFKKAFFIDPTTDFFINNNGDLVPISENNLFILNEDNQKAIEIDVEEVDTYLIAGIDNFLNTTFLITHNWQCFPAGTEISLENGETKKIEDIVEGDIVLSFNENTNEVESKKVIGLKQPIHNDLVKYHLSNGKTLTSTFDHPLYVNNLQLASFRPDLTNDRYNIDKIVVEIKIGDIVKLSNKSESKIEKIEVLPEVDTQTYIITVEDNHNFFANTILVHNK